jgi:crotonobetainyl-CoA:carnitine CoA-transferase CaiB-like acyl-CoA transferase
MTQALEGLRILDLSGGIAGPLGVLQLAEHGADVIKVEPPGGHPDRAQPSSRVYNRSRRSVTIDLKQPDGVGLFRELCATADVLVEAFAPGTMARLGVDYQSLGDDFPRLVYCSIPAWPTGMRYENLPGWEALVHARTGQQWENPSFRTGPVFLHSPVASMGAMFLVPIGIMSALVARDRTGRGQHVEISLLQGAMSLTTQIWNWTDQGQFLLEKSHVAPVHQTSIYECANREWVHASTMSGVEPTRSESDILGAREVPMAELWRLNPEEREKYEAERREAFRRRDRAELIEEYHAAGLGAEAIVEPHQKFDHPQLRHTGSVVEVDDPEVGRTTQLGLTIFLEGTPGEVVGPQPRLGAHTDEVFGSLGHDAAELASLRAKGVI